MAADPAHLSDAYFTMANVVAGFYVTQTIIFLNSLSNDDNALRKALRKKRGLKDALLFTQLFAWLYLVVIVVCGIAELLLRREQDGALVLALTGATSIFRAALIICLAWICMELLKKIAASGE